MNPTWVQRRAQSFDKHGCQAGRFRDLRRLGDRNVLDHVRRGLLFCLLRLAARKPDQLTMTLQLVVSVMSVFRDTKPVVVEGAAVLAELLKSAATPPVTAHTSLQPPKSHLGVPITGNSQTVNSMRD